MALTTCPECGKQISGKALACPGCGYPVQPQPPKRATGLWIGLGCLATLLITFCMAVIIGLLIWIGVSVKPVDEENTGADETTSQEISWRYACQKNLDKIALLKDEWATTHNAAKGAIIPAEDVEKIFAEQAASLVCPNDDRHSFKTSYEIGPIGTDPKCKCDASHNQGDTEEK